MEKIHLSAVKTSSPNDALDAMAKDTKMLLKKIAPNYEVITNGCEWTFINKNRNSNHLKSTVKINLGKIDFTSFPKSLDVWPDLREMDSKINTHGAGTSLMSLKSTLGSKFELELTYYDSTRKKFDWNSLEIPFTSAAAREEVYANMLEASIACRPDLHTISQGEEKETANDTIESQIENALKDTVVIKDGIKHQIELMDLGCQSMFGENVCPVGNKCKDESYITLPLKDMDFNGVNKTNSGGMFVLTLSSKLPSKGFKKQINGTPISYSDVPFTVQFTNAKSRDKMLEGLKSYYTKMCK